MVRADARHRIAVLGDDLTGAADAAAPFADRGLAASVVLGDALPDDIDVLALVTDSRWRPDEQATAGVAAAAARLHAWRPHLRFVKIDSTLRGRVHDDVATALADWDAGTVVATPAFPAQGRIVRDGALLVHGEPAVPRVADRLPAGVRVVDAATHEQLLTLAREIVDDGATAVGSGGLARALAEVLVDPPRPSCTALSAVAGVLIVAGTRHPATRSQVTALLDSGAASVELGRCATPVETAAAALQDGRRVVLTCAADGGIAPDTAAAVAHAEQIAGSVRAIVTRAPSAGLVLTGGATALAVAAALGATELRLHREVAEGLPLAELVAGDRRIPTVTKSGGFGDRDSLVRAAEALEACS